MASVSVVIGGQIFDKPIPNRAQETDPNYAIANDGLTSAVKFRVPLKKGETRLGAWFVNDENDGSIHGAYYVYVKKL